MDLNKEIKLSDLFKRREKAPKAESPGAAEPSGKKGGRTSFLKKDFQGSFRRRKDVDETRPVKEPRPPRMKGRARKASPALPGAPLMRAFNLLPKDDPRQTAAGGRGPNTPQLVLAVLALVLLAALASMFLVMNARVADKQRTYDDLREQLAARNLPAEEPVTSATDAALVKERQERTTALATALGARTAWDRLLREFSLIVPDDVWLKSMIAKGPSAAADANGPPAATTPAPASTFEITGYTHEQDGVARLLARMAVLPELSAVQLVSSTRTTIGTEEVVEFVITAAVKSGPGATAA